MNKIQRRARALVTEAQKKSRVLRGGETPPLFLSRTDKIFLYVTENDKIKRKIKLFYKT